MLFLVTVLDLSILIGWCWIITVLTHNPSVTIYFRSADMLHLFFISYFYILLLYYLIFI